MPAIVVGEDAGFRPSLNREMVRTLFWVYVTPAATSRPVGCVLYFVNIDARYFQHFDSVRR